MLLSPGERRMVKVSPILSIAKQNTVSGHSASVPVPANTLPRLRAWDGESAPAVRHDRVSLNTHVARPCVPVSVLLDVVQRDLDDFAVCGSVKVGAERSPHDHGFPELVILRQSVTRYLGLNPPGVLDFEAEVYVALST